MTIYEYASIRYSMHHPPLNRWVHDDRSQNIRSSRIPKRPRAEVDAMDVRDEGDATSLFDACERGDAAEAEVLLKTGVNMNEQFWQGRWNGVTPIMVASGLGHMECVDLLLRMGANVEIMDEQGNGPMHFTASEGRTGCMRALVDAKADVNSRGGQGFRPIFLSCMRGHTTYVAQLEEPARA